MGIDKLYRPVHAPSFTPEPNGIPIADLARSSTAGLPIVGNGSGADSAYQTLDSSGIAPGVVQVASVSLAAADIIGMNGTPVQILAAPGSGKAIVVESIVFEMIRSSTAFTGGGAVSFQYHTTTTSVPHAGSIQASVVTGAAGTVLVALGPNVGSNGLVVPANEGIDITNATAAFAAGTGTAKVFIKYRVITV